MERTVILIVEAFAGTQSLAPFVPSEPAEPRKTLFVPDAFSNPEHLRFGMKGGLAAILCYITYNLVAWPGLSTAMATCLLTALTTIGASRQKQILRFGGALLGGVIIGMGAQIFLLPAFDTIFGFTLLFVAVTILAAWFATSGPRLSYFGVQIAVAFYLINLQEFKFQTSLAVARDRVAGIMLGLFAMWLFFDQLWGVPAVVAMQRNFISTLRLLAQLMREPRAADFRVAIERSYALRETINTNFETLRQQADGVVLEFGSSRERDLTLRAQLLDWQRDLRSLFVARNTLLKYRLHLPGFELPAPVQAAQEEFDERIAAMLENLADRLEGKADRPMEMPESPFARLEKVVQECCPVDAGGPFTAQLRTFLPLSRRVDAFMLSLSQEISSQSVALMRLDPARTQPA
jgi:multidrug resistance protein MdtO